MFADDVSIYYTYKYVYVLKTNVESNSALIFEFARLNRLMINPTKTNVIRFRPHSANMDSLMFLLMEKSFMDLLLQNI